jgi:hypothetical protein
MSNCELTDEEKAVLVSMKQTNLPVLDSSDTILVYSGLVELLFSFCYTQRSFGEKLEPESAWMIAKISPMLSWVSFVNCGL